MKENRIFVFNSSRCIQWAAVFLALSLSTNLYSRVYMVIPYSFSYVFLFGALIFIVASLILGKKIPATSYNFGWMLFLGLMLFSVFRTSDISFELFRWLTIILFIITINKNDKLGNGVYMVIATMGLIQMIGVYLNIISYPTWASIEQRIVSKSSYDFTSYVVAKNFLSGYLPGFTHNAGFTATLLVNGLFAFLLLKNKMSQGFFRVCLVASVIAIFLTGKRGQALFLIVTYIAIYVLLTEKPTIFLKRILITSVIFLVVYFLGYLVYIADLFPRINRILSLIYFNVEGDISNSRFELWGNAIQLFKQNPIWGTGWGGFTVTARRGMEVHNAYLQVLCEAGVFAGIIFPFMMLWTLNLSVKKWIYRKRKHINDYMLSISIAYQLYFIVFSLVENSLTNVESYFMYFLMAALSFVSANSQVSRRLAKSKTVGRKYLYGDLTTE